LSQHVGSSGVDRETGDGKSAGRSGRLGGDAEGASYPLSLPSAGEAEAEREVESEPADRVAHAILVRKLSARDHTRSELTEALRRKNIPAEVAERVLERFAKLGLIDDRDFAQHWVESRQAGRHRSRQTLRRELHARGVARDVVEEALRTVTADQELAAARAYVEKAMPLLQALPEEVRSRRLVERLSRRGFPAEVIGRSLKDLGQPSPQAP